MRRQHHIGLAVIGIGGVLSLVTLLGAKKKPQQPSLAKEILELRAKYQDTPVYELQAMLKRREIAYLKAKVECAGSGSGSHIQNCAKLITAYEEIEKLIKEKENVVT